MSHKCMDTDLIEAVFKGGTPQDAERLIRQGAKLPKDLTSMGVNALRDMGDDEVADLLGVSQRVGDRRVAWTSKG